MGTSSATWQKLKLAANADSWKDPNEPEEGSGDTKPFSDHSASTHSRRIVEQGPRGDLHIYFRDLRIYEHWDWSKTDTYVGGRDDASFGVAIVALSQCSDVVSEECLVLKSQCAFPLRYVYGMKTYWDGVHSLLFILYREYNENGAAQVEARGKKAVLFLIPSFLKGNLLLKVSTAYLTVASEDGYIYVMRIDPDQDMCLCLSHSDSPHVRVIRNLVLSNVRREIGEYSGLSDNELAVKTAVYDHEPVYDLVGSWLVYCPNKKEVQYHKHMHLSENDTSLLHHCQAPLTLSTPVRLPLSGPLLNRVLSSVSNTAADKLFKLSDMGSKKVQSYLKKKEIILDKDVSLHSIGNTIGGAFLSTVDKLKKQAAAFGDDDIIRVMDLKNGQTMAFFKPPGGVSHLSLSPYDLHLVHANAKGDSLSMWDLCKLPTEVSLVGKFVRGKTSASIRDMVWFFNDDNTESLSGTNFGFGVITKRSGSVHWYNVNYLSGGNEANNYPNVFAKSPVTAPHKHQFADSWILPSAKAVKFCKLPGLANVPADISLAQYRRPMWAQRQHRLVQLAFIDSADNMRLISPLNGSYTFKYVLPLSPVNCTSCPSHAKIHWMPQFAPETSSSTRENDDTPLSLAEIETCEPYFSLVNDKSIEFSTYDFGDGGDTKFFDFFLEFGMSLPLHLVHMHLLNDLEPALATSDSDNSTPCVVTSSTSSNANSIVQDDPPGADNEESADGSSLPI